MKTERSFERRGNKLVLQGKALGRTRAGGCKIAYRRENGGDQKNSLSKFISYGGK